MLNPSTNYFWRESFLSQRNDLLFHIQHQSRFQSDSRNLIGNSSLYVLLIQQLFELTVQLIPVYTAFLSE